MSLIKTEHEKQWAQKLKILRDCPYLWAIIKHWESKYPEVTIHSVKDGSPYCMELVQSLCNKDVEQFQFWVYLEEHQGRAIEKASVNPGQYPWEVIVEFQGYQSDGHVRISAIVVVEKKTTDWLTWDTITVYRLSEDPNDFCDIMYTVRKQCNK